MSSQNSEDPMIEWTNLVSQIGKIICYSGALFEITVAIFFIKQFAKKHAIFCTPYFVIFTIGLVGDFCSIFLWLIDSSYDYNNRIVGAIDDNVSWYVGLMLGFATTLLALNRCTAIVFPMRHENIWSGRNVIAIYILLIFFPFIIHGHAWLNLSCKLNYYQPKCEEYYYSHQMYISCTNISQAILSLLIGLFAVCKDYSNSGVRKLSSKQKLERRILFLSIYLSLFLACYTTFSLISVGKYFVNYTAFNFYASIANILFGFYHYGSVIIFMCLSKHFYKRYFAFMTCGAYSKVEIVKIAAIPASQGLWSS